ncbi:MAG: D-alanyl-D-alanine carboxypeptidase [Firmicutes bacterium]|nr:D-alanyl-D-alanine carboxypeptidase [Bacillota bacterium]
MEKNRSVFVRAGAVALAALLVLATAYGSYLVSRAAYTPRGNARAASASTSARAMATIEVSTGRVLYSHNMHQQMPMASTTKIVTAAAVLDNVCESELDTLFVVDKRALGIEGTSIYLQEGEEMSLRDLLYAMMLRSGNDASVALAFRVSRSVNEFSVLMNEVAKKAGAKNSNFKNPHGLDQDGHLTTAYDLAMITAYAMRNPIFREIVATTDTKIPGREYKRTIQNKNKLLRLMETADGVKTGFTSKAGRCFVGSATDAGMTVVSVVLNCGPMFEETRALMELGLSEYTLTQLIEKDQMVGDFGIATESFSFPLKNGEEPKIARSGDHVVVTLGDKEIYKNTFIAIS